MGSRGAHLGEEAKPDLICTDVINMVVEVKRFEHSSGVERTRRRG